MKTVGLIGGVSWESTLEYYRQMNELVKAKLGGFHSCKCLIYSFDFSDVHPAGNWEDIESNLKMAAITLQMAGADCIVVCSNTMHRAAKAIQSAISIPLLDIIDITAQAIKSKGMQRVALLGTSITMSHPFFFEGLRSCGIEAISPKGKIADSINSIIFKELVLGRFNENSRELLLNVIDELHTKNNAEGIILGCTELPLLVNKVDTAIPLFDTIRLHTEAATNFTLTDLI